MAVLGDMAELGEHTGPAHVEIGQCAANLKIGQLFTVGKNSAATAQAGCLLVLDDHGTVSIESNSGFTVLGVPPPLR